MILWSSSMDVRTPPPDTLFALGSCSKAFTATAIALLADEGKIALDSPVEKEISHRVQSQYGGVTGR